MIRNKERGKSVRKDKTFPFSGDLERVFVVG